MEEQIAPINLEKHAFNEPKKEIKSIPDMRKWNHSMAYHDYLGFIMMLNEYVKGKSLKDDDGYISEIMRHLLSVIDKMSSWVDDIPPINQPQRFGNKAFRTWFEKLQLSVTSLLREALPDKYSELCMNEISVYLLESVGNSTRIDYGTGHEASFVMFLCCLYKIGALTQDDAAATVLRLFNSYLLLCRKLQQVYKMEPAGSQGVWSLDDFQFVPFIWGSSQLRGHSSISPSSFPEPGVAGLHASDYMFMSCIQHISQVKTGPFAEHSNQLWNISGAASWDKINTGLIKMYKAEILSKFPIIQHVMFGSLMSIDPLPSGGDRVRATGGSHCLMRPPQAPPGPVVTSAGNRAP